MEVQGLNSDADAGVIKPLFCVLEDELLSASDELLRKTGQPHHVVHSHNELNVAEVASCVSKFLKTFLHIFPIYSVSTKKTAP